MGLRRNLSGLPRKRDMHVDKQELGQRWHWILSGLMTSCHESRIGTELRDLLNLFSSSNNASVPSESFGSQSKL